LKAKLQVAIIRNRPIFFLSNNNILHHSFLIDFFLLKCYNFSF
jgi:hypothetical protein